MTASTLPPKSALDQRLRYEPESGKLFWLPIPNGSERWNRRCAGREAFTTKRNGYLFGTITIRTASGDKTFRAYAHRVIWVMCHGTVPDVIDHINGNRSDNRLSNLRSVTAAENCINMRLRVDNTSGKHGVWLTDSGTWKAYIKSKGEMVYLGNYPTKEYAMVARSAAEKVLGFHENHGNRRTDA